MAPGPDLGLGFAWSLRSLPCPYKTRCPFQNRSCGACVIRAKTIPIMASSRQIDYKRIGGMIAFQLIVRILSCDDGIVTVYCLKHQYELVSRFENTTQQIDLPSLSSSLGLYLTRIGRVRQYNVTEYQTVEWASRLVSYEEDGIFFLHGIKCFGEHLGLYLARP